MVTVYELNDRAAQLAKEKIIRYRLELKIADAFIF
jgi:hypothetical protein